MTHRDWRITASIWLLGLISFVSVGAATIAAWWTWGPTTDPFSYIEPENDRADVTADGILLFRTLVVTRTVDLHLTRDLVRRDGQHMLRIALPESRATYTPGRYELKRIIELPSGVPPGRYEMQNVVHWRANPMRYEELRLPPIVLEVPPDASLR